MTNRITKIDMLVYVPGVPERAYVAGGWYVVQRWPREYIYTYEGMRVVHDAIGDWDSGDNRGRVIDGYVEHLRYTAPIEYRAAVPAYYRDDGVAEWNAGGTSVSPLDGDGAFQFKHSPSPGGVVTGFSTTALSHLPHEATHAFYISGDVVKVMELGVIKHTFAGPADPDEYLTIQRVGTTVYYTHGAETHASATPITSAKVYLDTALYLSGDYVDDPSLSEGTSGATEGDVDGELRAVTGQAGIVDVDASVRAGGADATLKRVHGVVANYEYSFVDGDTQAVRGEATDVDESFFRTAVSTVGLGSPVVGVMKAYAVVSSGLRSTSSARSAIFVADAVYDALVLIDGVSSNQSLADVITSALALGTDLSQMLGVDLSAAQVAARTPTQYAVHAVTGALTTYDGFDFDAFATTDQVTFGTRADGVYRIRPTTPDDAGRIVAVNFGSVTLDTMTSKTIEYVHLGIDTDGDVIIRLVCGDIDVSYRAVERGDVRRAITGKGIKGRTWDVSLEVTDATYFSLDSVELTTASIGRRWPSE